MPSSGSRELEFTRRAEDALLEILDFLLDQGASLGTAQAIRNEILQAASRLKDFPRMGEREPRLMKRALEYRSISVKARYRIVYYLTDERIIVTDILDTRRDPWCIQG